MLLSNRAISRQSVVILGDLSRVFSVLNLFIILHIVTLSFGALHLSDHADHDQDDDDQRAHSNRTPDDYTCNVPEVG